MMSAGETSPAAASPLGFCSSPISTLEIKSARAQSTLYLPSHLHVASVDRCLSANSKGAPSTGHTGSAVTSQHWSASGRIINTRLILV